MAALRCFARERRVAGISMEWSGVGFNSFPTELAFEKTASWERTQTCLISFEGSRGEFSDKYERRDARNRSEAGNFPKRYPKFNPRAPRRLEIHPKSTPRETETLPRMPPGSSPGNERVPGVPQASKPDACQPK